MYVKSQALSVETHAFFVLYHPEKTREWDILCLRKQKNRGKRSILRVKRAQIRIISCDYD